jgi:hypothetical protein
VDEVVDNYCPFDDADVDNAYNEGFADGQDAVECETCPPPVVVNACFKIKKRFVCRDPETGDKCAHDWWPRECGWEETLVPTECPEKSEPLASNCIMTCVPTGNGGTICKRFCTGIQDCDPNCDPNDPICIPCDLEVV